MKDVEKDVTIPFKYISNVFTGRFYVMRSDFKIGKMKGFHKAVGDTILCGADDAGGEVDAS